MFGSGKPVSDRLKQLIGKPDYQHNASLDDLKVPDGNTAIKVSLINPVTFGPSQLDRFMSPDVPGLTRFDEVPSFSFLLEHPSGRKLVWDLGIRADYENYAPAVANYIPKTGYHFQVHGDVAGILKANGVSPESVEGVIWSHWHWDHIGNPETFPSSTALITGPGFKEGLLPAAPTEPKSPLLESAWRHRELRELDFQSDKTNRIGQFPAIDYFQDGSLYLLHSPGHAIGHISALARTTVGTGEDTFVFLGGDICHYSGIMRPSRHLPVPEEITPHPLLPNSPTPFCPGHAFEQLQDSRGRHANDTLYDMTFGYDIPLAQDTVKKLQELDAQSNILVIIAHDKYVGEIVDHFPKSLNDWKQHGWGRQARWAFLRDLEAYWKEKGLI